MGACHSLPTIPLSRTRRSLSKSADVCLVAGNGSVIPTHSYETFILSFENCKYIWKFIVADVTLPVLGADFPLHFLLLVDVAHRRLINAEATFQRLIDGILVVLPFCVCYVDDILVFSSSKEEHLRHLCIVLNCLQQNGLVVRYDKCTFDAIEVSF
ncbi:uncharacterized protein [Palaemon carinicauda]|uniref:uncharacterized protein n=1 Tax=Palaemon carinicauda TaxID=392227 RepID=UPI0035B64A0B